MEIKKQLEGTKLTVALIGRLDAVTAIQLDKDLAKSLNGVTNLIIDLEQLSYIASAGLRILLKNEHAGRNADKKCSARSAGSSGNDGIRAAAYD